MALFCAGCVALGGGEAQLPPVGAVYARSDPLPLTDEQLSSLLASTQVLLVGEVHDHLGHHQAQLSLLKAMTEASDKLPVVGIEWLDHTHQEACDQLSAGRIGVAEFARLVDWANSWGYPLELYTPILEFVAKRRLRLVALNAPLGAVRLVSREGLASLSPALRVQLAGALDLNDHAYRACLAEQFRIHGQHGSAQEGNFFTAQVARDETMAERLARELHPWPDGGGRAVVLAGEGHLAHGKGLPPRIARRLPGARLLTALAVPAQAIAALRGPTPTADWPADLLVVSAQALPPPPSLGVVLKPQGGRFLIELVLPASAAEKAGWRVGDLLVSLDGVPLTRVKQIHDILRDAPLAEHAYSLLREGNEITTSFRLKSGGR
jgi:uncharacterized iron-regulated protein